MCDVYFLLSILSHLIISHKIKSAPTEADAQKTQTPVVAKLTLCEMGVTTKT
jgi:hypothetical protein